DLGNHGGLARGDLVPDRADEIARRVALEAGLGGSTHFGQGPGLSRSEDFFALGGNDLVENVGHIENLESFTTKARRARRKSDSDSFQPLAQHADIEIDEQTYTDTRQLQISDELCLMNRQQ